MKIAIIDYGMGNLFSVQNACRHVGLNSVVTSDKNILMNADGIILPGVGAFGRAMDHLGELDLIDPIKRFIKKGNPFMGICLGMQLLFSESEEFGNSRGLGAIKGRVRKFPPNNIDGEKIKVPQIGWNQIFKTSFELENSPLNQIRDKEFMYFVHSYYVDCSEKNVTLTTTRYGDITYSSSVLKENIFATQFHPEKSANKGIQVYRNWAEIIKKNK
jgi:imidazole glycerol-phosphate synthase subunit HisH